MMLSPICYSKITNAAIIQNCFCGNLSPVAAWLAFGKLPENPVVTPTSSTQVIYPSANNKYLQSVTVNPIPTSSSAE